MIGASGQIEGVLEGSQKAIKAKIIKENKLSALQEMAASGELGRLRNFQNHYGDSALILAAWYGHLDIAKLLLDVNADVDIANCDGNTALNCAAYRGHASMVELLGLTTSPLVDPRSPLSAFSKPPPRSKN